MFKNPFPVKEKVKSRIKILFLLKKNSDYGTYSGLTSKSGLLNSSKFLLESLISNNLVAEGKIILCDDGNSVDKVVHDYRPDLCIIEALWVTPGKLDENIKLHPGTKFVVRIHSNIPFIAMEGIAMDWMNLYPDVAFNSSKTKEYMESIISCPIYLPNIDQKEETKASFNPYKKMVDIGCFGSIRPLKNQLMQAAAAIAYGDYANRHVNFHINAQRIEQAGESVLKNIRGMFKYSRHNLVEHGWLEYDDFIRLIGKMDIGLQVSYTESFNIVSADFVHVGVPIITSPDISWQHPSLVVDPNDALSIRDKIYEVIKNRSKFISRQSKSLEHYNKHALKAWELYLNN